MKTYLTKGTVRNPDAIRPAPTLWERTHPVGSAERHLYDAGEAGAYAAARTATRGPEPLLTDAMEREGINPEHVYNGREYAMQRDDRGGEDRFANGRNFLATDKVPDTIFGIPVAKTEGEWTEGDKAFFAKHPEAGGYYSMGDETEEDQGGVGAGVVKKDAPVVKGKYPGKWNNPGNVRPGSVEYAGQNGTALSSKGDRFLTFDTPQHGLDAMARVIGQISRVKIREAFEREQLPNDKFTIENLVSVYAPSDDGNDVDEYAGFVRDRVGVGYDEELKTSDTKTMAALLEAMVRRDSGHPHADWFEKGNYLRAAKQMEAKE